jgi:hypothetical protein
MLFPLELIEVDDYLVHLNKDFISFTRKTIIPSSSFRFCSAAAASRSNPDDP